MAAVVRLMSVPAWLYFYVLFMLVPACNNDHSLFRMTKLYGFCIKKRSLLHQKWPVYDT